MNRFRMTSLVVVITAGALVMGGCPFSQHSALKLQDWGRDLLFTGVAVLIGEAIDNAQQQAEAQQGAVAGDTATDPNATDPNSTDDQSGSTVVGPAGPQGEAGADGQDGIDGQDGVDGQDGQAGADGQDGEDGQDGADGQDGTDGADGAAGADGTDGTDGEDFAAVAIGCVNADGEASTGYGFSVRSVEQGLYEVVMTGYEFPMGFSPDDLVVMITDDDITRITITTYAHEDGTVMFEVYFEDFFSNAIDVEWCFRAYDGSDDPYVDPNDPVIDPNMMETPE